MTPREIFVLHEALNGSSNPGKAAGSLIDRLSAEGFVIVPKVATDEMVWEGLAESDLVFKIGDHPKEDRKIREIWTTMIEAATRGRS